MAVIDKNKKREANDKEWHEAYPKIIMKMDAFAVVNGRMVPIGAQVVTSAVPVTIEEGDISPYEFYKETNGEDCLQRLMESLAIEAYEARQDYKRELKGQLEELE